MSDEHKQVYWDSEKQMLYWIEWIETGNSDIPIKHYITIPDNNQNGKALNKKVIK
jgi:hypothetical protein